MAVAVAVAVAVANGSSSSNLYAAGKLFLLISFLEIFDI